MSKRYYCDPEKNSICKKTFCKFKGMGECEATLNKEYAELDDNGKPIEIDDTIPTIEGTIVDLERAHEESEQAKYAEAAASVRSVISRLERVVEDLLISKAEEAEKLREQAEAEAQVWR